MTVGSYPGAPPPGSPRSARCRSPLAVARGNLGIGPRGLSPGTWTQRAFDDYMRSTKMNKKKLIKKLIKNLKEDAARLRQERDLADHMAHEERKAKKEEKKAKEEEGQRRLSWMFQLLPTILPIVSPTLFGKGRCGCADRELSPEDMAGIVSRTFGGADGDQAAGPPHEPTPPSVSSPVENLLMTAAEYLYSAFDGVHDLTIQEVLDAVEEDKADGLGSQTRRFGGMRRSYMKMAIDTVRQAVAKKTPSDLKS